jgi:hypothetical protein
MLRTRPATASELRVGDVFLLNDLKSFESMGTFYLECYAATSEGAEPTKELQAVQILEVARNDVTTRIEVLTSDRRTLDFEFSHFELIVLIVPDLVAVENLAINDYVVLRGDYNPSHLTRNFEYALISRRDGLVSKVLKVVKTWRGTYRVTVLFGGVKKLPLVVDAGSKFEVVRMPNH